MTTPAATPVVPADIPLAETSYGTVPSERGATEAREEAAEKSTLATVPSAGVTEALKATNPPSLTVAEDGERETEQDGVGAGVEVGVGVTTPEQPSLMTYFVCVLYVH
jgi:hypothetical protein